MRVCETNKTKEKDIEKFIRVFSGKYAKISAVHENNIFGEQRYISWLLLQ